MVIGADLQVRLLLVQPIRATEAMLSVAVRSRVPTDGVVRALFGPPHARGSRVVVGLVALVALVATKSSS